MAESKLRDLSTDFAVKVIKMCDSIKGHNTSILTVRIILEKRKGYLLISLFSNKCRP